MFDKFNMWIIYVNIEYLWLEKDYIRVVCSNLPYFNDGTNITGDFNIIGCATLMRAETLYSVLALSVKTKVFSVTPVCYFFLF